MPVAKRRRPKPLLVGEQNPYGDDPYFALYPAPDGCSGHRLCCLILGMRRADYLREFDRTNLCAGPWDERAAGTKAVDLIRTRIGDCRLILLGSKVCRAFGVPFVPFTVADDILLRLPHPSGRCRTWSEVNAFGRARAAVIRFAPEIAHLIETASVEGDE